MKFTTIEEFLEYLEAAYSESTEDITDEDGIEPDEILETPAFDNNARALNALFRNAMNEKHFSAAYDVLVYANEHQVTLTKGR